MKTLKTLVLGKIFTFLSLVCIIGCSDESAVSSKEEQGIELIKMSVNSERLIKVNVYVYMENDLTPVTGVNVFNDSNGQLIGQTKDDGRVSVYINNGQKIRVVEPNYGLQQGVSEINVPLSQEPVVNRSWAWNQQSPYQN
jgi:hypothetical protein